MSLVARLGDPALRRSCKKVSLWESVTTAYTVLHPRQGIVRSVERVPTIV